MKIRISFIAVLVAALVLGAAPAGAQKIGSVPQEPGATLLLPYFEVDLANAHGATTRFSINNSSATAVLAHVTVWSDLAVPVLAFNVYLTGYDVSTIDMRDVVNGRLPQSASAGADPNDQISPKGDFSQDINFASCNGQLPLPAVLPQFYITHIKNSLTGKFTSIYGACTGTVSGNLARGYVTVDTVNNCTLRFVKDPGYITSDMTFQNVLWGDFSYVNTGFFLQGAPLITIAASLTDPAVNTAGNYTFYGRYGDAAAWMAQDHRNPLATNFAGRFVKGATMAIAWRDPKVNQKRFTCGTLPPWYPMGEEGIVIFDEQEHPQVPVMIPVAPQPPPIIFNPFRAATQKVVVGSSLFPVPFSSGWLYYDLNTTVLEAGNNPPVDPAASQAWIMHMRTISGGSFGNVGLSGGNIFQFDSAVQALHFLPGQ
jgi:hypothetical protein